MQHPQPTGDRCAFPRNLTRGTYGGDVNCLQQHLAHQARAHSRAQQRAWTGAEGARVPSQGFLTEEEPTGYFGAHTEAALRKWQVRQKQRKAESGGRGGVGATGCCLADALPRCRTALRCSRRRRACQGRALACSTPPRAQSMPRCAPVCPPGCSAAQLRQPRRPDAAAPSSQRHGLPAPESGRVFPDTAGEESKTCIDVCAEFAGQQDCQTRCVRRAPEQPRGQHVGCERRPLARVRMRCLVG